MNWRPRWGTTARGAAACAMALVGLTSCQPTRPAWLGGQRDCALNGPIVEDPDVPAVPKERLGVVKFALYHVLPELGTKVRMRLRIDENGNVTSACPVVPVDADLVKAIVRYAVARDSGTDRFPSVPGREAPFLPARANGRDVASALVVEFRWEAPTEEDPWPTSWKTRSSTDVAALEAQALATCSENAELDPGAAYARLGELGTPQARQAVQRIEQAVAGARRTTPSRTRPAPQAEVYAETTAPDGTRFRVIRHSHFNGVAFALTWRAKGEAQWAPEYLLPVVPNQQCPTPSTSRLRWIGRQRLEFSFTDLDRLSFGIEPSWNARPKEVPRRIPILLPDLTRDRDGDGWTDIEEERMFLDPSNPDTDGDGLPDGLDPCPNLAAPAGLSRVEDDLIVQKALLAVLGLPPRDGLRFLLAGPDVRRVSLLGVAGPVIYGHATESRSRAWARGAHWVGWRIVRKTPTDAAVEVDQSSGGLAGVGYEVFLRKRDGIWWVVLREMTWMS